MIWLKYIFSSMKKITNVKVEYDLITKSGNVIYSIEEDFKPKELIIKNYSDFKWRIWEKIVRDKYGKIFDDKARHLLNDFIKKERKKIKRGWMDSGDYIIKCVWDINVITELINYKEYKILRLKK